MTRVDIPVADRPLSVAVREGSRAQHSAAERTTFTAELLAGRIDAAGYADYLRALRVVYAALEEVGAAMASDPVVALVHDPALERLAAVEADLAHWGDGSLATDSPAAHAYADRIRAAAGRAPRFVAHHYTRYLGDLSGGQAIGRVLDRAYGGTGRGLRFYAFDAIARPKAYKDRYRERLDALPLGPAERAEVVAEVQEAFGHNQALLEELGAELDACREGRE